MSHSQNAQNAALCQAARAGDTQTVLKLLQERDGVGCHANPNTIADADNNVTVLMLAAEHGDVDMVHALLEAGASWQERSLDGCTPGEYAMANRADRGCFQLLLEWAVQCEMILGRETLKQREEEEARHVASNDQYLASTITYATDGDIIDDSSGDAVMMTWETPLMERHAADICWKGPGEGVVLNIGFGMGIVDAAIQKREPKRHVIIEAHPDVYRQMLRLGWDKKENVTVVFGRWQDVIDDLAVTTKFDGIFFDTYGEYYEDMQALHKRLPSLMNDRGVYSFFNGLSPDNIFFHLVAGEVARRELNELGFSVSFHPVDVDTVDSTTWDDVEQLGSGRKYWHFPKYFAPVCVLEKTSNV